MSRLLTAVCLVWLTGVALGRPVAAELLVELDLSKRERSGTEYVGGRELHHRAWIGDGRARLDRGRVSYVLTTQPEKVLLVLEHSKKAYWEFPVPLAIGELLPEPAAKELQAALEAADVQVVIGDGGEPESIGEWKARKYRVEATAANGNELYAGFVWLSEGLPEELALYEELLRAADSIRPIARIWQQRIHDLPGVVVQRTRVESRPGREVVSTETLSSLHEVPAEEGRYSRPAGYSSAEVDPKLFVGTSPYFALMGAPPPK